MPAPFNISTTARSSDLGYRRRRLVMVVIAHVDHPGMEPTPNSLPRVSSRTGVWHHLITNHGRYTSEAGLPITLGTLGVAGSTRQRWFLIYAQNRRRQGGTADVLA